VKTNVLLTKSSCFIKFYNQRNEAHSTLYSIVVSSSMCSTFQSYTKKTESVKRKYILFILKFLGFGALLICIRRIPFQIYIVKKMCNEEN